MIIIDSLMDAPLQDAIHVGKAPALQFLMDHGTYYPRIVSSFPTMSVVIDSTLLTGTMPNKHGIFGLCYYLPDQRRLVNFGTGAKESIAFGVKRILSASMMELNQHLLSSQVSTIHEATSYPTGSINATVYRGKKEHTIIPPTSARLFKILPNKITTRGPEVFSYGSMHPISPRSERGGMIHRYGMNDRFSQMEISELIRTNRLPAFTISYMPKNDDVVHQKGTASIKGIKKADQELQSILNVFSSWEEAIEKVTWIILGDSGQTNSLPKSNSTYVHLDQTLQSYRLKPAKEEIPREQDQIVLAVNERMAYVYVLDPTLSLAEVSKTLQSESSLDLIVWKEEDTYYVISGTLPGQLQFQPNGPYIDEYQQSWQITGDLSLLDLTLSEDQTTIEYNSYPDPLERLRCALDQPERVIVVTATTGYELVYGSSPTHKGASHGSLHQLDSLVPMIVCGEESGPTYPRLVDMKQWILQCIDPSTQAESKESNDKKLIPQNDSVG